MSEPVTLYNASGETLTVYTAVQVDKLLAGGQWVATAPGVTAGPEAGADVEEAATGAQPAPAVEEAAPSPPAKRTATKRARSGL